MFTKGRDAINGYTMLLTEEEELELKKLLKIDRQYAGIMRTSPNPEAKRRAGIDLKKVRDRIHELCPDGVPENLTITQAAPKKTTAEKLQQYEILSQFSIQKTSLNCDDKDVNMLATVLRVWEDEFVPAIGDNHLKLEFSLSQERDSHFAILENIKRSLKQLINTIEDFALATREDFKAQLHDMKLRYTRHYLSEGIAFLKRIKQFWQKVDEDIQDGGQFCLNAEEIIEFNQRFESATFLEGYSASRVVSTSVVFITEAIDSLNLPDIPLKR